jgi:hypothetical protein
MPNEHPARFEDARELSHNAHVFRGMRKEPERREEIEHCIEPLRPSRRHLPHVASGVSEARTGAALSSNCEQLTGVIQTVHVVSRFGQQVRVAALPARNVEYARCHRKSKQLDEARRLLTIALCRE